MIFYTEPFDFLENLYHNSYIDSVGVAELADALGLGPSGATRESSTLSSDT